MTTFNIRIILKIFLCFFFIVAILPYQADGCGWWGDGETDDDVILVGDDGKPIQDEEMPVDDPAAQTMIGNRFRNGEGVDRDYKEAVQWYRKAAEQDYEGAQNNLAAMYEKGLGVPKDEHEALKWYRRAAEQGNVYAQHSLGSMYRDGRGGPRDHGEAAKWILKAAEQGHKGAFKDMGELHWKGSGVPQNNVLAYMWWKLASLRGDEESERSYKTVAGKMTSDKISEAEKMVREWRPDRGSAENR
jgi:TPR repeat protein